MIANTLANNIFRPKKSELSSAVPEKVPANQLESYEQKLQDYEEQLAHLSQQKELHTLALKEMYQFLCKLDTSFKAEYKKLKDQIETEQVRSTKLIEITKGLWDIIELMDEEKPVEAEAFSKEVSELTELEVEILDESDSPPLDLKSLPKIEDLAPMMAAAIG